MNDVMTLLVIDAINEIQRELEIDLTDKQVSRIKNILMDRFKTARISQYNHITTNLLHNFKNTSDDIIAGIVRSITG